MRRNGSSGCPRAHKLLVGRRPRPCGPEHGDLFTTGARMSAACGPNAHPARVRALPRDLELVFMEYELTGRLGLAAAEQNIDTGMASSGPRVFSRAWTRSTTRTATRDHALDLRKKQSGHRLRGERRGDRRPTGFSPTTAGMTLSRRRAWRRPRGRATSCAGVVRRRRAPGGRIGPRGRPSSRAWPRVVIAQMGRPTRTAEHSEEMRASWTERSASSITLPAGSSSSRKWPPTAKISGEEASACTTPWVPARADAGARRERGPARRRGRLPRADGAAAHASRKAGAAEVDVRRRPRRAASSSATRNRVLTAITLRGSRRTALQRSSSSPPFYPEGGGQVSDAA